MKPVSETSISHWDLPQGVAWPQLSIKTPSSLDSSPALEFAFYSRVTRKGKAGGEGGFVSDCSSHGHPRNLNRSPAGCARLKRTIPLLWRTGHVGRAGSPVVAKRSRFDWLLSLQSSLPSGADWLRDKPRLHSRIVPHTLRPTAQDRRESQLAFCGPCFSCSTQVHILSSFDSTLSAGLFFGVFFWFCWQWGCSSFPPRSPTLCT